MGLSEVPSDNNELFSETQLKILCFTGPVTGFISFCGSLSIMYTILSNHHEKLKHVYQRLMLGLSVLDALSGLGMAILGPWAMPPEVSYTYGARGNWALCEASGFFLNIFLGTVLYSASLSIFFALTVRFEWKEERIAKQLEPFMHALAISFPLITGPYAIANDFYNPVHTVPGVCWVEDYPAGCASDETIPCIRGENYRSFGLFCSISTVGPSAIAIVTSMILIVLKVRRTELRMRQYAGSATSQLKLTKETGKQGLLYIGAVVITYTPLLCLQLVDKEENKENRMLWFSISFISKVLSLLQGAFNAYIYHYRSTDMNLRASSRWVLSTMSASTRFLQVSTRSLQSALGQSTFGQSSYRGRLSALFREIKFSSKDSSAVSVAISRQEPSGISRSSSAVRAIAEEYISNSLSVDSDDSETDSSISSSNKGESSICEEV